MDNHNGYFGEPSKPVYSSSRSMDKCSHVDVLGKADCNVTTGNCVDGQFICRYHDSRQYPNGAPTWVGLAAGDGSIHLDDTLYKTDDSEEIETYDLDENIDWSLYGKDNYGRCWREGKFASVDDIHFRLKAKGPTGRINLFHAMMKAADTDYPLDPERKRTDDLMLCAKCKGFLWKRCVPEPEELKRAARQAGLTNFKVISWLGATKCNGIMQAVKAG